MNQKKINTILRNQRDFFQKGITLDVSFRIRALQRLKVCIKRNESAIHQALQKDLGKSNFESYMCETGMVYSEITYMLKHLRSFARDRRVPTPLSQFHAVSFVKPSPYGTVLIMSPWNYPFMLTMEPLVDALSAGNTAVVKPSAYFRTPARSSAGSSMSVSLPAMWLWSPEAARKIPASWNSLLTIFSSPAVRLWGKK